MQSCAVAHAALPPCRVAACPAQLGGLARRRSAMRAMSAVARAQPPAAPSATRRALLAGAAALPAAPALAAAVAAQRVQDPARTLSPSDVAALERKLAALEADTGFRVRVLASEGSLDGRDRDRDRLGQARAAFGAGPSPSADPKLLVVIADPSQQSVLGFAAGTAARAVLPRDFFSELQGRYGNIFYIRDNGADGALRATVAALDTCLRAPCRAVPGVPSEGAWLTLGPSVIAGAVLGYALRQRDAAGRIQPAYVAATAPLWAFLLVSFGILPVRLRDEDPAALAPNLLGFAAAAGALYLTPILGRARVPGSYDGDGDGEQR